MKEYYMVIPKDIAKELHVEGRHFPAPHKETVIKNRRAFFGSILAKRIKIKSRYVRR